MSRFLSSTLVRILTDYEDPRSAGSRLRARRIEPLLDMITAVHACEGHVRVVDIGGTETFWRVLPPDFLDNHDVVITVVNLPDTPTPTDHGRFRFIAADGCNLDIFEDSSFHIAHSNSVIEHVGDWERMVAFSREVSRVASGYFVQTPNFWFPFEPHFMVPFFHWLPRPLRVRLVLHFAMGQMLSGTTEVEAVRIVESTRLLDRTMLQALFEDARITTERFAGLPKSLIAVRHWTSEERRDETSAMS